MHVHMRRDTPLSLYAAVRILDDSPSTNQLRTYLIYDPILNQKTYKDIWISYSLKCKHSKKIYFFTKN